MNTLRLMNAGLIAFNLIMGVLLLFRNSKQRSGWLYGILGWSIAYVAQWQYIVATAGL